MNSDAVRSVSEFALDGSTWFAASVRSFALGRRTLELVRELEPFLFLLPPDPLLHTRRPRIPGKFVCDANEQRTNRNIYFWALQVCRVFPWLPTRGLVRLDATLGEPPSPSLLAIQHAQRPGTTGRPCCCAQGKVKGKVNFSTHTEVVGQGGATLASPRLTLTAPV